MKLNNKLLEKPRFKKQPIALTAKFIARNSDAIISSIPIQRRLVNIGSFSSFKPLANCLNHHSHNFKFELSQPM